MAVNVQQLASIPFCIRDISLNAAQDTVNFVLVYCTRELFAVDKKARTTIISCESPVVCGRVILARTQMQSDGNPIPYHLLPESLEKTLETYIGTSEWNEIRISSPVTPEQDQGSLDGLLKTAAQLFKVLHPDAPSFAFGMRASEAFNNTN